MLDKISSQTAHLHRELAARTDRPSTDAYAMPAQYYECWLGRQDSNLQPTVPKTGALPIELLPNVSR